MTDRVKGLTIILDHDIRTDDIEPLIEAISLLRGVAKVTQVMTTSDDYFNRERIRLELEEQLYQALSGRGDDL